MIVFCLHVFVPCSPEQKISRCIQFNAKTAHYICYSVASTEAALLTYLLFANKQDILFFGEHSKLTIYIHVAFQQYSNIIITLSKILFHQFYYIHRPNSGVARKLRLRGGGQKFRTKPESRAKPEI